MIDKFCPHLCLVRAIYPYQSQSTDELDLQEGDILELSSGPTGGENFGGGWWEGKKSSALRAVIYI